MLTDIFYRLRRERHGVIYGEKLEINFSFFLHKLFCTTSRCFGAKKVREKNY